jgi:hypothetical protein
MSINLAMSHIALPGQTMPYGSRLSGKSTWQRTVQGVFDNSRDNDVISGALMSRLGHEVLVGLLE